MHNPFVKASRRIIKKLGKPITILIDGVELEPKPYGIFDDPEGDSIHKGRKGQLILKQRQKSLTMMTEDIPELNKDWIFVIKNIEYFAAKTFEDEEGCTLIYLADEPLDSKVEEGDQGGRWR